MPVAEATPAESPLARIFPKLLSFARLAESLANRFKGLVRFLALSGLLAAIWLGYFALKVWDFSVTAAAIGGGVLAVPALALGWCYSVLDEASGLPRRLWEWGGQAKNTAGELRERFRNGPPPEAGRGRFRDLRQLGGLAVELKFMGDDARELLGVFGGSLTLANPLFLFALAGAALAVGFLDLSAAVAGLFFLFR
jgi:hypothetical protein